MPTTNIASLSDIEPDLTFTTMAVNMSTEATHRSCTWSLKETAGPPGSAAEGMRKRYRWRTSSSARLATNPESLKRSERSGLTAAATAETALATFIVVFWIGRVADVPIGGSLRAASPGLLASCIAAGGLVTGSIRLHRRVTAPAVVVVVAATIVSGVSFVFFLGIASGLPLSAP
jgi:hypothetical protein